MAKTAKRNAVSAKTAKLLRQVAAHILEEPKRYDQGTWAQSGTGLYEHDYPACNTKACIGGWAVLLNNPRAMDQVQKIGGLENVHTKAKKILSLTVTQADRLFADGPREDMGGGYIDEGWPVRFWNRYARATKASTRAKIAAERIEHFIKTGE